MPGFTIVTAVAAILPRDNVDTDAIIPSREIISVSKTGLGPGLFAGWRYLGGDKHKPDPRFVLNDPAYRGARILLTGENFGCGSSREHAVWALAEYGFRVVVAASFSPIFFRNCVRNGVLPAQLAAAQISEIAIQVAEDPQSHQLTVNLVDSVVTGSDGRVWPFRISEAARNALILRLDPIDVTSKSSGAITAFRDADRRRRPWVYEPWGPDEPTNESQ